MPVLLFLAVLILIIWLGFHFISWIVGGLVDVTGGWINLLVIVAIILFIWYIVLRKGEKR